MELEWCMGGGSRGHGAARLASQSEGRPQGQVGWGGGGGGAEGGQAPLGSAGQGGFSCTAPGSSLLSSTSPLFVPLPLGCQIWLTQSVVSLLRLAPGPKPSALHHHSSPCTRREGEGGTEGPGTSGQLSTFFFAFLITLPACPRCWGLLGAAKWGLEAGQGIQSWGDPRARA